MRPNPNGRETIRERLNRDHSAIHTLLTDPAVDNLVLTPYGDGHAWLRPEPDDNDPRFVLTQAGRRDLAMAALFDRGPTVAEASTLCPACHQPQTAPSCATREHWGV